MEYLTPCILAEGQLIDRSFFVNVYKVRRHCVNLQKAEQALASWEAALKYERKVQYRYLKERVKLQKQLIKQSDCYTQILREQAEQERQKVHHFRALIKISWWFLCTGSEGHSTST